ncbi:hypothetical protein CEXT_10661 [Caerostris extrusa]|uniref:Uncharacterized protein n=1 Tax=Caerostris extrusa TaxID=172846 RepID=A0AAV4XVK6_CAEEX|nr:hypothetical protein CEXT_10661 [Caerostris extrusa]
MSECCTGRKCLNDIRAENIRRKKYENVLCRKCWNVVRVGKFRMIFWQKNIRRRKCENAIRVGIELQTMLLETMCTEDGKQVDVEIGEVRREEPGERCDELVEEVSMGDVEH